MQLKLLVFLDREAFTFFERRFCLTYTGSRSGSALGDADEDLNIVVSHIGQGFAWILGGARTWLSLFSSLVFTTGLRVETRLLADAKCTDAVLFTVLTQHARPGVIILLPPAEC